MTTKAKKAHLNLLIIMPHQLVLAAPLIQVNAQISARDTIRSTGLSFCGMSPSGLSGPNFLSCARRGRTAIFSLRDEDTDDDPCSGTKPFREEAQDEIHTMAELCMMQEGSRRENGGWTGLDVIDRRPQR